MMSLQQSSRNNNHYTKVENLFNRIRSGLPSKRSVIDDFENYVEADLCYDYNGFVSDIKEELFIRDHLFDQNARDVYSVIESILSPPKVKSKAKSCVKSSVSSKTIGRLQTYAKYNVFNSRINTDSDSSSFRSELLKFVTSRVPNCKSVLGLLDLNVSSHSNALAMADHLITLTFQSYMREHLSLDQFIDECDLFVQIREQKVSSNVRFLSKMQKYILDYVHCICKPLPCFRPPPSAVGSDENDDDDDEDAYGMDEYSTSELPESSKSRDNISQIMRYISVVNHALNKQNLFDARPIQFDLVFVPPNTRIDDCDLSASSIASQFNDLEVSDPSVRGRSVAATSDVNRLIRKFWKSCAPSHYDRIVMLVVRGDMNSTNSDFVYIYKHESSLPKLISDHCELVWHLNGRGEVARNLDVAKHGCVMLSHHLHSQEIARVYLSFAGKYHSRVFKKDLMQTMPVIFAKGDNEYNLCGKNAKCDFENLYKDWDDVEFEKYGQYLFGLKRYSSLIPNKMKKGVHQIYISKNSTAQGLKDIDATFFDEKQLYNYLRYSIKMQRCDNQTREFEFVKGNHENKKIMLVNPDLRDKKSGKSLFLLCTKNDVRAVPEWKMDEFVTETELISKFGISKNDLPVGSRQKHSNFQMDIEQLSADNIICEKRDWLKLQNDGCVIRSQIQKKSKKQNVLEITQSELDQCINEAYSKQNYHLLPIISLDYTMHNYFVENLFLFNVRNSQIGLSFRYDYAQNAPKQSAIFLDKIDIYNKCCLVDSENIVKYRQIAKHKGNITDLVVIPDPVCDDVSDVCDETDMDDSDHSAEEKAETIDDYSLSDDGSSGSNVAPFVKPMPLLPQKAPIKAPMRVTHKVPIKVQQKVPQKVAVNINNNNNNGNVISNCDTIDYKHKYEQLMRANGTLQNNFEMHRLKCNQLAMVNQQHVSEMTRLQYQIALLTETVQRQQNQINAQNATIAQNSYENALKCIAQVQNQNAFIPYSGYNGFNQ